PTAGFPTPCDAGAALPYWTARYRSTVLTRIYKDPGLLDSTSVAMISANPTYGPGAFEGNFSVQLTDNSISTPVTASISQIGEVPAGTQSIRFSVRRSAQIGDFTGINNPYISLNGLDIPTFAESASGDVR